MEYRWWRSRLPMTSRGSSADSGQEQVRFLNKLNVPRLRDAIKQVLTEESYKQNALRLQAATLRAGGVTRAADIIEQAIFTGKPAQTQQ